MNKLWHTSTMNYYPAAKINDLQLHASTWMNLKINIMQKSKQNTDDTMYVKLKRWQTKRYIPWACVGNVLFLKLVVQHIGARFISML